MCWRSIFCSGRTQKSAAAAPAKGKEPGLLDLVAERIEARGNPVQVLAPSQAVRGIGQRLEYHLLDKFMRLESDQEVVLQKGSEEIHARSVLYQPGATRHLDRVVAPGPGWFRGQPPRPSGQPASAIDQPLEAIWNGELSVEPKGSDQVLAIRGGAQVTYRGIGRLTAQEIFLWLAEDPRQNRSGAIAIASQPVAGQQGRRHRLRPVAWQGPGVASLVRRSRQGRAVALGAVAARRRNRAATHPSSSRRRKPCRHRPRAATAIRSRRAAAASQRSAAGPRNFRFAIANRRRRSRLGNANRAARRSTGQNRRRPAGSRQRRQSRIHGRDHRPAGPI